MPRSESNQAIHVVLNCPVLDEKNIEPVQLICCMLNADLFKSA